jgi:hypothetical protein
MRPSRFFFGCLLAIGLILVVCTIAVDFSEIRHWLAVHTGTVNESGPYYGFWSGFGSDLGEVTILGAVVATARHHNCHVKGCWRLGKHQVAGGQFKVCPVHHPAIGQNVTAEDVQAAHDSYQDKVADV